KILLLCSLISTFVLRCNSPVTDSDIPLEDQDVYTVMYNVMAESKSFPKLKTFNKRVPVGNLRAMTVQELIITRQYNELELAVLFALLPQSSLKTLQMTQLFTRGYLKVSPFSRISFARDDKAY